VASTEAFKSGFNLLFENSISRLQITKFAPWVLLGDLFIDALEDIVTSLAWSHSHVSDDRLEIEVFQSQWTDPLMAQPALQV
jgi:hypothetical protein